MRSSAILKIEIIDEYCFLWLLLTPLPRCNIIHPNKNSNYRQNIIELNIESFDFINGSKCSDAHKVEKFNNLSINIIELVFYQDQNMWRHELIPIAVSKNESDKVIDLLI